METEPARSGRLDSPRVWRAAVLGDGRVFLRQSNTNRPGFSVDLVLDASSSRMHCQEVIAAQGYILAESLGRCGVPVRVSSFCSLRGYTVLRVLKGFGDKNGSRKIFNYFASGWNRDGLALRAAGELIASAPEPRHLLLLTDASPNDSHRIPPGGPYPLGRDYADQPAVEDAAREVRALQQKGIRVGAVFMGEDASAENANAIYGRSMARIRTMDQLADYLGLSGEKKENFLASVENYNAKCAAGYDDDFGKNPSVLFPVAKAPFYGFTKDIYAGYEFLCTTGGLWTDNNQRVYDEQLDVIPGLYATGNCCGRRFGVQYSTPIAGVSVGMAQTLGRELGKYLAAL